MKTLFPFQYFIILFSLFFILSVKGQNAEKYSDDLLGQPRTIELHPFKILIVNSGIQVNLIPSDENKLVIYGDRYNGIVIKEKGNNLKLRIRLSELIHFDQPYIDLYYNESLKSIKLHQGAVVETVRPIKTNNLILKIHEGSEFSGEINSNYLTSKVHTGSFLRLSGKVKNHVLKINTGGVCLAEDLITKHSIVKANSGGDGKIYSESKVWAKAAFGGFISIKGTPNEVIANRFFGGEVRSSKNTPSRYFKRNMIRNR